MAAPMVAGAAALILSVRPQLTCEQVKQILTKTARRDGFAASAPDNAWGSGKLDITAAVQMAFAAQFAVIRSVSINPVTIEWQTDVPTTGTIRFHTKPRHLELGKSAGSRTDLVLGTNHALTLTGLSTGTYFCEILAFTQDNLLTADDNNGSFYVMNVP
jgi:hypothetical protein